MPKPVPPSKREGLRELAHLSAYVRPYRRRFIVAMVASFISMGFGAMFPFFVKHLLDAALYETRMRYVSVASQFVS